MNNLKSKSAFSSRIFYLIYLFLSLGIFSYAITITNAQTLEDWKAALAASKDGKGPESIPYSDLREKAATLQSSVNENCKEESWSCKNLGTKSIREEIKGRGSNIESIKNKIDQLGDEKYRVQTDRGKDSIQSIIDDNKKLLDTKSNELDSKKRDLESDLNEISRRIDIGNKCLDSRTSVQAVYQSAVYKARSESNTDIKEIVSQLIEYWEKREKEHEDAFNNTKAGIENCKKCKDGDM